MFRHPNKVSPSFTILFQYVFEILWEVTQVVYNKYNKRQFSNCLVYEAVKFIFVS